MFYEFFKTEEIANGGVLLKKKFINTSQYSHEKISVGVSLQESLTLLRDSITDFFL